MALRDLVKKLDATENPTRLGEIMPLVLKITIRQNALEHVKRTREAMKYVDSLFGTENGLLSSGDGSSYREKTYLV